MWSNSQKTAEAYSSTALHIGRSPTSSHYSWWQLIPSILPALNSVRSYLYLVYYKMVYKLNNQINISLISSVNFILGTATWKCCLLFITCITSKSWENLRGKDDKYRKDWFSKCWVHIIKNLIIATETYINGIVQNILHNTH